jgi:hypothetical protein
MHVNWYTFVYTNEKTYNNYAENIRSHNIKFSPLGDQLPRNCALLLWVTLSATILVTTNINCMT